MSRLCLVVGAAHAAAQLAPSLRQEGWEGEIVVLGEEGLLPYHRPPLSKALLAGSQTKDMIAIRPRAAYDKAGIGLRLNTRVEGIERGRKQIRLDSGETLNYDKLALTVGARVRRLEAPGVDLRAVHYLRNMDDVDRIRAHIAAGTNAVIVGGGYIGLETAAVLNRLGMKVTVIEKMERVLQRVTAPEVSEFYARVHREEGVRIICGVGVEAFEGEDVVRAVRTDDGGRHEADLVIIGVGIVPNVELAREAGLEVDNGIVVDEFAVTSDPDIVAAGDCTFHYNRIYDTRLRLESVQNASDQARTAAASLCGKKKPYDALPWFWSDQYDLKLQIAGLSGGYDELVIRGEPERGRRFAAFYLKDNRIIAVDAVNMPQEFMAGKRLITGRIAVDKARLADAAGAMKELMP